MRVSDLLQTIPQVDLTIIYDQCSQFLEESGGCPLLKNLPKEYGNLHKVKVRKRKKPNGEFADIFNEAFTTEIHDLRERAVFANGRESFEPSINESDEPFYIFPIDGYRFLYSKEVENSNEDYQAVLTSIFEKMGSDKGSEIITELLKFTYNSTSLMEGIEQGSEIILYNIPYFFAIRASAVSNYESLFLKNK